MMVQAVQHLLGPSGMSQVRTQNKVVEEDSKGENNTSPSAASNMRTTLVCIFQHTSDTSSYREQMPQRMIQPLRSINSDISDME